MAVLQGRWVSWLGNGLSLIVLILAVFIAFSSAQNRSLQDKVNGERTALAKAQTLAQLDNGLVQLLAKTAAEKNDTAIQALLAQNGITFRVDPNAAGAHAAAEAPSSTAPAQ